jgi:poly-gamma-glutamate capsule biosynthesis protein CapA/YwtB (metallophosphatase superfamily)
MRKAATSPVRAFTPRGKLLVILLRLLYRLLNLFIRIKHKRPRRLHHEDPARMSLTESLYLGSKYYLQAPDEPENDDLKEFLKQQNYELNEPEGFIVESKMRISAGGDLMPYKMINKASCRKLWQRCGDYFFDADLVFANLETPVDLSKPVSAVPEVMLNHMLFNADEEMFDVFSGMGEYKGYDVLSVINNHSLDQGEEGLKQTLRFLRSRNIAYCGARLSETEPRFSMCERQGIKIAIVGATFSLNQFAAPKGKAEMMNHILLNDENCELARLKEDADLARAAGADMVVLSLHMGPAYQAYPGSIAVENMIRACEITEAGLVIGTHPHHMQAFAVHRYKGANGIKKEVPLLFSMGDFVACDIFSWGHASLMMKAEIEKGSCGNVKHCRVSKIELMPVYLMTKGGQKIESLEFYPLYDFEKYENQISENQIRKEWESLLLFSDTYVFNSAAARSWLKTN